MEACGPRVLCAVQAAVDAFCASTGAAASTGRLRAMRLLRAPLAHAIALAFGGDHGRVMREAIEQRGRELLVAGEDGDPLGKGEVRRDDRRAALVAIREQIEEQLAAGPVKRDEAELVDDQDIDEQEPALQAPELARVAGFEQQADEIGGPREEHAAFDLRRFEAERDRQVRLAGADRAGEDQILGAADPVAAGERVDLRAARPSAAWKSKLSSVLTSGNRASRSRWRMTDSWRDCCSAARTSWR